MSTAQQNELYLLSARGNSGFAKRTAGMELIAELHEHKKLDMAFLEEGLALLAAAYCAEKNIPTQVTNNYGESLREMATVPSREMTFAYLTDKDNGELHKMVARAAAQGLRVETRTRTKH